MAMKITEAVETVKNFATEAAYEGDLTEETMKACAEVYLSSLGANDDPFGNGATFMKAPNGKKSHLNRIQWLLVRTPDFLKWFGKSVVTDENGEPRVMFHGSAEQIDEFKTSAIGVEKSRMTLWSGPGFYFTDKRKTAIIYGKKGGTVMDVFLHLENPLVVDETGNAENYGDHITRREAERVMLDGDNTQWLDVTLAGELARMDAQGGARSKGKAYYRSLSREQRVAMFVARLKTDVVKLKCVTSAFGGKSQTKMLRAICKHTGHDGVIHKIAPDVTEWVVYEPKAIKSATGNDGAFNRGSSVVLDTANDITGTHGLVKGRNKMGMKDLKQAMDEAEAVGLEVYDMKVGDTIRELVAPFYVELGKNPESRKNVQLMHENIRGLSKEMLKAGAEKTLADFKERAKGGADESRLKSAAILFAEYADALHDVPDQMLANAIGKVKSDTATANGYAGGDAGSVNAGEDATDISGNGLKGTHEMNIQSIFDALKRISTPGEVAMDIVDRNGRHHQPKAIPEGGQFEEEGQYAATAAAKEEHFHKKFATTDNAKTMRTHCADLLARIDSSKLGNDTMRSDYVQQVHKYANLPKKVVLAGAAAAYDSMKNHAAVYEEVKGMNKDEFSKWLKDHKEYDSTQMQNLMTNPAYNKAYKIKDAQGNYIEQDHAAWEEAKMMVGRKACGSMIDYMAHIEALNNTPDELIQSFLNGKGGGKHKGGHEAYEQKHGISHGEGETAKNVTMSEINAVESELSKAWADSKDDDKHTAYAHALSHFLGKDGGLRDPEVDKDGIAKKVSARIEAKEKALSDAKAGGNADAIAVAENDVNMTKKAADVLKKVCGIEYGTSEKKDGGAGEPPPNVGENVPTEKIEGNPKEVENKGNEPESSSQPKKHEHEGGQANGEGKTGGNSGGKSGKKTLTEAGKKLHASIGNFLNSESGKKYSDMADKVLSADEKGEMENAYGGSGIKEMLDESNTFKAQSKEQLNKGDKKQARNFFSKYIYLTKMLFKKLGAMS